ncbi:MAG: sigma factor [Chloroflexota bacterium]
MLAQIQAIADVQAEARPTHRQRWSGREREWLDDERQRLAHLAAACNVLLASRAGGGALDRMGTDHAGRLCAVSQRLFDELLARLDVSPPAVAETAASDALFAEYVAAAWEAPARVMDELRAGLVEQARRGDRQTLAELEDAAGLPADLAVSLLEARQAGSRSEAALNASFARLHERFADLVFGYVRPKVRSDDAAHDVCQQTWAQVWQRLATYDPLRGSFERFVKYWAHTFLKRHYDQRKAVSLNDAEPLIGADHTWNERMIQRVGAAEEYERLLRATFGSASPPHQLIAFGFCKLLEWRPAELVADRSDDPLRALELELERTYGGVLVESGGLSQAVAESFERLRLSMDQRFDVAVQDPKTLATHPALHARIVGDTAFRDYYTGKPTDNVTQWWDAVKRRVMTELLRQRRDEASKMAAEDQPGPARNRAAGRIEIGGRGDG